MEVDEALSTSPVEGIDLPSHRAEGHRRVRQPNRSGIHKIMDADPPERRESDGQSDSEETDAHGSILSPFKLHVSDSDDEDIDNDDVGDDQSPQQSAHRDSIRRQLLQSPLREKTSAVEIDVFIKRKRYDIRRSGSDDCLIGFDEQNGEAEVSKDDKSDLLMCLQENPMTASELTENSKKSPGSACSPTGDNGSPMQLETQSDKAVSQQLDQSEHHVVAENEESNSDSVNTRPAATQSSNSIGSKKPMEAQSIDFYKKPFEYGWKRELVWRANIETSKDKADVYFITPGGKKLRTRSDIAPLLEGDLTLEHFSFAREPLGVGPEFETVRSAKPSSRVSIAAATLAAASATTPIGKRISKPKGPKGASPPPQGWTATRALKVNNAALHSSSSSSRSGGGSSTPTSTSRPGSVSSVSRSSKAKKQSNDIENDLKQINESIRNYQKSSTTNLIDPTNQQHNAALLSGAATDVSTKYFATNFFANVSFAYDALLCILKYLKIHERPRAASVCKLWHLAAKDTSLWQTVRMKNSKVCNWAGFAAALRRGETTHLDLRKMLISNTRGDDMWQDFSAHIGSVYSLESIDLCRCSARVVEGLFKSNRKLRVLNAVAINDDTINLDNIGLLKDLQEVRLRTCDPGVIAGDLKPLQSLAKLEHLSLTAIRGLGAKAIELLGELTGLRSLELGECGDFGSTFAETVLPKLENLRRLRLENGQETNCCTLEVLNAVAQLQHLTQLELVNFDIKPGFEEKLRQCTNIRKLLIIPTYISQSATTNHIVISAVQQVSNTLQVFTWGVTVELLRVTALYVDQCEESNKKEKHHFDECIPVLKPVPGAPPSDGEGGEVTGDHGSHAEPGSTEVPQIEILPLDKVNSILLENLPKTKFKIVKLSYHATCRQQLVE